VNLPERIGRYEVELLLGEGGIGRVLLARDPVLGRQVAIKVLRGDLELTPAQHHELTERVSQEARAAATLSHPGMITLHDMGHDERLGMYLVFELVRGPTLRERLHDGPLPPDEVAHIARSLGSALSHAHAAGLVHRGVKPENVMLAPTGPKLTDFGIGQGDHRAPGYTAPEPLTSSAFGASSDEFALASTMYEALTGRCAFPGDDPTAVAALIASGRHAAARSALPVLNGFLRLDAIFSRALAPDPKKRFPSCDAFGSALATELTGSPVTFLATPGPAGSTVARATRRWQNGVALLAVAVILALIAIGRLRQTSTGDDKPGVSLQRVVPPVRSHPGPPSPLAPPGPSATRTTPPGASVHGRGVDP
jgi:serine/threonine-protein kinase